MANTLLLSAGWDLTRTPSGQIAVATGAYALAQDAASAIRLFQSELWYDTRPGVPYFESILGQLPPLSLIKASFVQAALRVPGVVKAECFISGLKGRVLTGQVHVTDQSGQTGSAAF